MTPVASGDVKIIADDTPAPAPGPMRSALRIPLLPQFYQDPITQPIIKNTKKLTAFSAGVYLVSALAFALLVYNGATTTQDVSVTLIVPTTDGLGDGFVCTSLGTHTGYVYECAWIGETRGGIADTMCHPASPPQNCPGATIQCPNNVRTRMRSSYSGWTIKMENVHFASFADCVGKIGSIVNTTMAAPTRFVYRRALEHLVEPYVEWPPYSGPIKIGDDTAKLSVLFTMPLRFGGYNGAAFEFFISPEGLPTDMPTCAYDSTNYNADGTVIPNSAIDIFFKSVTGDLLLRSDKFMGENCRTWPTPESMCEPFKTIGPYSCEKTTKISQPILQVLGSSLSNAATLMTFMSVALAWFIKKTDERGSKTESAAVAPKKKTPAATETTAPKK